MQYVHTEFRPNLGEREKKNRNKADQEIKSNKKDTICSGATSIHNLKGPSFSRQPQAGQGSCTRKSRCKEEQDQGRGDKILYTNHKYKIEEKYQHHITGQGSKPLRNSITNTMGESY